MMHFGAFFFFFCSSGSSFVFGGASFVLPSTYIFCCYRNGIVISFLILVRAGILSLLSIPPPAVEVSPFLASIKPIPHHPIMQIKKYYMGGLSCQDVGHYHLLTGAQIFFTVPHSDSRKKWDILSPVCN